MFRQFDFNTFINGKQGECVSDKRGNDVFCFHTEPEVFMDKNNGLCVIFGYTSKYNSDPTTIEYKTLYKRDFKGE